MAARPWFQNNTNAAAARVTGLNVRLTGLRGAAHLNGREGVVRGRGLHSSTFRHIVSAF
jgi:hypothetical protein